jgi:proton-translocating NADH-quinone oxidoreductase chain N
LVGFLFKLAAFPFHMWAPDVYQGAPLATTTFFSTIPKIAVMFALARVANLIEFYDVIGIIAAFSILVGTVMGLAQVNIKRLLSYSAISHVGFILIGLTSLSFHSALLYVFFYVAMSLATFAIVSALKSTSVRTNYSTIQPQPYFLIKNLRNLGFKQPLLALAFAIVMFSFAGVPPLAGFFSKYYVLSSAIYQGHLVLAFIGILGSSVAAFYYIKLIQLMFFHPINLELSPAITYKIS